MKHIIIRKPKFMRDEAAEKRWLDYADWYSDGLHYSDITLACKIYYWHQISKGLDKAAKAAGFFRTKDYCKWRSGYLRKD